MKQKIKHVFCIISLTFWMQSHAQDLSQCDDVYVYEYNFPLLEIDVLTIDHNKVGFRGKFIGFDNYVDTNGNPIPVALSRALRSFGDINGDGLTDEVMYCKNVTLARFGKSGFNDNEYFEVSEAFSSPRWGYQEMRRLADIDGDGLDDIIGFGYDLVFVAFSKGDGSFYSPITSIREFTRKYGWGIYSRTIRRVVDINGDNAADIVGFYGNSLDIAISLTNGQFQPNRVLTNFFIPGHSWKGIPKERQLKDMNYDGLLDAVGYKDPSNLNGPRVIAYNNGDGSFQTPIVLGNGGGSDEGQIPPGYDNPFIDEMER